MHYLSSFNLFMAIGAYKFTRSTILQTNGYNSDTTPEQEQKCTRGCLNKCFNSGENSLACTSTFAANMKAFSQQKINCSEQLYGGPIRCKQSDGTTI